MAPQTTQIPPKTPLPPETDPARKGVPVVGLWPVYVATKGRAGRITPDVLSLKPILVLEGPERARYQKAYPELPQTRLEECGRGVAYARNGLIFAAREDGCEWCWMLDDDLFDFQRRRPEQGPQYLEPEEALLAAQKAIARVNGVALAGLPVAWAKEGNEPDELRSPDRIRLDVNCYCCVALHLPSLTGLSYRTELKLREDTDFSLQVLARGQRTLRVDSLAYQMPICGTGTGGLAATYAENHAKARANRHLAQIWPGIVHTGGDCLSYWCDWKKAAGFGKARRTPRSERTGPEDSREATAPPITNGRVNRPRARAG